MNNYEKDFFTIFFHDIERQENIFYKKQKTREKNDYYFFPLISREIFIYKHNCHMIPFVLYTNGEDKDRREWKKILKSK